MEDRGACDRCGKSLNGIDRPILGGWLRDYGYSIKPPEGFTGPWDEFTDPGETKVCKECLRKDPRFQAYYSSIPGFFKE